MTTGQRIQQARKNVGLSQKQLGVKLGLSASMIGQWENDLRNPKKEALIKIADALGVSWLDLAGEEKALELTVGKNAAKQILHESAETEAVLSLLTELYGSIEDKNVVGEYGSCHYYLVGTGNNKFILYEKDLETLKNVICGAMQPMVDRLKDIRPEQEIITECTEHLNSEETRNAMNAAMEKHLKHFPFITVTDSNLSPPLSPPQSTPPTSEWKDTTPPPDAPKAPPEGE